MKIEAISIKTSEYILMKGLFLLIYRYFLLSGQLLSKCQLFM